MKGCQQGHRAAFATADNGSSRLEEAQSPHRPASSTSETMVAVKGKS
jgi:hypothetical protein